MAWNEPGKGSDPWGNGGKEQGPPDLDEIVKNLQKRFGGIFGGRPGRPDGKSGGSGPLGLTVIALVAVVVWGLFGFYEVDGRERGVVLRFGELNRVTEPGLRWHLPSPIEAVEKVNVSEIQRLSHRTEMLTSDENIVVVDVVVQYRRTDPLKYLFNVRDPDGNLAAILESAIREVVGKSHMDFIVNEGRAEIAQRTDDLIQATLDSYDSGIEVYQVNLQDANFPNNVEAAVQDVNKAREDKIRLAFEAQSYANDILPRARGEAVRRTQDAEGYRARVIADAQGEASRFEQLLVEYQRAPEVTRERLYLEGIEYVMSRSTKILLDSEGSGNLVYLPLDKLMNQAGRGGSAFGEEDRSSLMGTPPAGADTPTTVRRRSEARSRGAN